MSKTIPKNVKKAFLVSSFMGSVLKSYNAGRPVLFVLHKRINQGMRRFNIVGGREAYWNLTNEGLLMWTKLSKKYSTKLTEDETEIFIEMIGHLLSKKDYKDFLGVTHFKSTLKMQDIKFARICESVIALGEEIDEHVNTKPCSTPLVFKKVKVKKVRDKSSKVSSKVSSPSNKKLKEAKRKSKVRSFLKDIVKLARKEV